MKHKNIVEQKFFSRGKGEMKWVAILLLVIFTIIATIGTAHYKKLDVFEDDRDSDFASLRQVHLEPSRTHGNKEKSFKPKGAAAVANTDTSPHLKRVPQAIIDKSSKNVQKAKNELLLPPRTGEDITIQTSGHNIALEAARQKVVGTPDSSEVSDFMDQPSIGGNIPNQEMAMEDDRIDKVAICFFGQVKHYEHVADSVKRHIFDVLRADNYTFDIFAHTYNLTTFTNPRNRENNIPIDPRSLQRILNISDERVIYEEPDAADARFDIQTLLTAGDPWPENPTISLRFMGRQLYSLMRVTGLWNSTRSKYKYCIYLRPDTVFRSDIDLKQLELNLTEGTLSTPGFGKYGGINDRLAFGPPSAMEAYGRRGEHLIEYVLKMRRPSCAESYLEKYLELRSLTNVDSSILFYRVRADGRVETRTA
jgi:hypothetical protein